MKNKNNVDGYGCLTILIMIIVISAVTLGCTYLIATSDLPEWVKFWLLK